MTNITIGYGRVVCKHYICGSSMWNQIKNNIQQQWTFFALLGIFLASVGVFLFQYDKIEGHLLINAHYTDFGDWIFPYITYIGDGKTAAIVILALFIWRIKYGFLALSAFLFTTTITHGLKFFVFEDAERPYLVLWEYFDMRPDSKELVDSFHMVLVDAQMRVSNSFPSGHTTSAFSIFCLLALVIRKKTWGVLFALLAIVAAFSRVYLSQHFAEDIFAGAIIGSFGTLLMASWLSPKLEKRFAQQRLTAKRTFDFLASLIALIIGLPFLLIISLLVLASGKGGVFFKQQRVGIGNKDFGLLKFRTMRPNSEQAGQITVGGRDPRITKVGYFLRKFKMDELPQLINILKGDMSIVGPRPEVRKYVDMYSHEQLKVLTVKPGLTDFASIEYMDENVLLGESADPEKTYIQEVMPAKLQLNLKYIAQQSFLLDLKLIFKTIFKLFR